MKIRNYVRQGLEPGLRADVFEKRNGVMLNVTTSAYQPVFMRECRSVDEALELLNGFVCGYEYMGARWCEATRNGLVPIE